MEITKIEKSVRKNKRYKITLNNGDSYHFGLDTGSTTRKNEMQKENDITQIIMNVY
jgi:hypothetical protein